MDGYLWRSEKEIEGDAMKSLFVHQRKNIRVGWRTSATTLIMRDLRVVKAVTRNVSVHGALLYCDEPLEVGTKAR